MIVGVPKETVPGERRVALVPDLVPLLTRAGLEVVVQSGAGREAGCTDSSRPRTESPPPRPERWKKPGWRRRISRARS